MTIEEELAEQTISLSSIGSFMAVDHSGLFRLKPPLQIRREESRL